MSIPLKNALLDQLNAFINELTAMYPEDSDFSLLQTTFRLMRQTNPALIISSLHENVGPYYTRILSKDDTLFNEEFPDADMNILAKLKKYFMDMDESTKNCVFMYCQNITKLSVAIHNVKSI
jgi:hypothetical protein